MNDAPATIDETAEVPEDVGIDGDPGAERKGTGVRSRRQDWFDDLPAALRGHARPKGQKERIDRDRTFVTGAAMVLLVVSFLAVLTKWYYNPEIDLDSIAVTVLTPIIAFAGPIAGFYFGQRRK